MTGHEAFGDRAVFEPVDGSGRFMATEWAIGPWSPEFCHGGAPSALLVHVAEQIPALVPMDIVRVTIELLRPAPIGFLDVEWEIARDGRKLQLILLRLLAGSTEVSRASVLRLRVDETPIPELVTPLGMDLAGPASGRPTRGPQAAGFSAMFDMQSVQGGFQLLGPASVWFRMRSPLVRGKTTSAAARAVAAADFGNGIAGVLPFEDWAYPSTDLTVSFGRRARGEWTMIDAKIWANGEGRALCHSRIGDESGWLGHALQTSIVEKR